MSCKNCEARRKLARDAYEKHQVLLAAKHVVIGAAEMIGLKEKTAAAELKSEAATRDSGAAGKPAIKAKTTAQE